MRRALFLHIQKTAGTSIQVLARRNYGNLGVCSHGDFLEIGLEGCRAMPFASGHFGFAFARAVRAERYFFTILRDPAERLVSLYQFCASQPPEGNFLYEAANRLDLDGFLALADQAPYRQALWNNMVWQLTYGYGHSLVDGRTRTIDDFDESALLAQAIANLATFDHVGFVETIDADIDKVFRSLGAAKRQIDKHNVSPKRSALLTLPASTREQLDRMTLLDRQLYDHARRRYADQPRRQSTWLGRLMAWQAS